MARSHTGSLTSPLDLVDAACRAAGVVRVNTPAEVIDVARMLLAAPRHNSPQHAPAEHPRRKRVRSNRARSRKPRALVRQQAHRARNNLFVLCPRETAGQCPEHPGLAPAHIWRAISP